MSRMERAISRLYSQQFEDIRYYSQVLCREVLSRQRGDQAEIHISGYIPHVGQTLVSREKSIDTLKISVHTRGRKKDEKIATVSMLGMSVMHITACPCTQTYNSALFPNADPLLLPTHSQRSITTLIIEDQKGDITFNDLYLCLTSSVHVTQDLLKRPDEAELVLSCHSKPQFAEDVVRMVCLQTGKRLGNILPADSRIRVESISMESIHLHNVKCAVNCTLEEITSRMT